MLEAGATTEFVRDPVLELVLGASSGLSLADAHVLASLVALACAEAQAAPGGLCRALGLEPAELADFLLDCFPGVGVEGLDAMEATDAAPPEVSYEEECLRRLLFRFSSEGSALEGLLSKIVARRCLKSNHLWQDLGLSSRDELSALMERHFASLAARNERNMKWKKFLYRMVCLDGSSGLCPAPTCGECADFAGCFGDEAGISLLARHAKSSS